MRPLLPFRRALQNLPDAEAKLLMGLNRSCRLNSLPPPRSVVFMVGPEGGWTEEEERLAQEAGFQAVSLGRRVLRTETAALAAIAAMQTLWGDF